MVFYFDPRIRIFACWKKDRIVLGIPNGPRATSECVGECNWLRVSLGAA